jgi:hypothetical protein
MNRKTRSLSDGEKTKLKIGTNTQKAWYPLYTQPNETDPQKKNHKAHSTVTNPLYTDVQEFLQMMNMPRCNITYVIKRLYALVYKWSATTIQNWFHPVGTGEPFLFRVILTNNRNLPIRLGVLQCLVQEFGFDINQRRRHDLSTILHIATWRNRSDIIPVLLRLGANSKVVNVYLETPGQSVRHRAETDTLLFIYTSVNSRTPSRYENGREPGKQQQLKELAVKLTDMRASRVLYQEYFNFDTDSPSVYLMNTLSAQTKIMNHIRGSRVRTVGFHLHRHLPLLAYPMSELYREVSSDTLDVSSLIFFLNRYLCSRYFRQKNKTYNQVNLVTQGVNQAAKVTQRIIEDFGNTAHMLQD